MQYFLDDFWNFQKIYQIWTLGPRIYHQHTSKDTEKLWKHPWKYDFRIWESEILSMLEGLCATIIDCCWILKFWNLKLWKLEELKFESLQLWNLEIGNVNIWNLDLWHATFHLGFRTRTLGAAGSGLKEKYVRYSFVLMLCVAHVLVLNGLIFCLGALNDTNIVYWASCGIRESRVWSLGGMGQGHVYVLSNVLVGVFLFVILDLFFFLVAYCV